MKDLTRANELHNLAMDFADEAFLARRRGKEDLARDFFEKAFRAEKEAAEQVTDTDLEPTRSVLFRSAATLALDCGKVQEAEKLVLRALLGNPPNEIESELKDLFERIQFDEHLGLFGVALGKGELQLTLVGKAVSEGMVHLKEVIERLQDVEKLVFRTKARIRNQNFTDRLKLPSHQGMYLSPPRAGSFAVTLKVGEEDMLQLPNFDDSNAVVEEFMECMELLQGNKLDLLQERIDDQAYFQNFVGLAKKIAPDGEEISMVGLTAINGGIERRLCFFSRCHEIPDFTTDHLSDDTFELADEISTVAGVLRFADALKGKHEIKLEVPEGNAWTIIVPVGLMEDVVRPFWGQSAIVEGYKVRKKHKTIQLTDIMLSAENNDESQTLL